MGVRLWTLPMVVGVRTRIRQQRGGPFWAPCRGGRTHLPRLLLTCLNAAIRVAAAPAMSGLLYPLVPIRSTSFRCRSSQCCATDPHVRTCRRACGQTMPDC